MTTTEADALRRTLVTITKDKLSKEQLASIGGRAESPSAFQRSRSLRAMKIGNSPDHNATAPAAMLNDLQLPADFELDSAANPLINQLWEAVSSDNASPIKGMSVIEAAARGVREASGSDSSGHGAHQTTDISESEYTTPGHSRPGTGEKPTGPDMATKIDLLEGELKAITAVADKRLRIILNLLTRLDSDDLTLNQEAEELSKERLYSHLTQSQVENQNMRDYIKMLEDDLKDLDSLANENKFLKEQLTDMQKIIFINPNLDRDGIGLPPTTGRRTEVSELFDEQPSTQQVDEADVNREMSPTSRQIISQMKSEDYQQKFAKAHGIVSHESFGYINAALPQPDDIDPTPGGPEQAVDNVWDAPRDNNEVFNNKSAEKLSQQAVGPSERNPSQQIFELMGQVTDLGNQVEHLQGSLATVVESKTLLIQRSCGEIERLRTINKYLKREVKALKDADYARWIKRTINAATSIF